MSNVWPLQRECDKFYGNPRGASKTYSTAWARDSLTHVDCPWPLRMGHIHIPHITIHRKCAPSLARVLSEVWNNCGHDFEKICRLHYDVFSGSFVYRNMRNGSQLSMHSYGCAIDFDAPDNMLHDQSPLFSEASPIVKAFKSEGWVWGGNWGGNSIDAMHFQAARVR
jgi:hypothetical protein